MKKQAKTKPVKSEKDLTDERVKAILSKPTLEERQKEFFNQLRDILK